MIKQKYLLPHQQLASAIRQGLKDKGLILTASLVESYDARSQHEYTRLAVQNENGFGIMDIHCKDHTETLEVEARYTTDHSGHPATIYLSINDPELFGTLIRKIDIAHQIRKDFCKFQAEAKRRINE